MVRRDKVEIFGPLTKIFSNSTAMILDQSLLVGSMQQSILMLSEVADLSYNTTEKVVKRLVSIGLMEYIGKIKNVRFFRFKMDNVYLHEIVQCAHKMQVERLREEVEAE